MAKIGAVLLAAGASVRFGASNKLLVDIGDRSLIRSAAEAMTQGGIISEIVVVTGCDRPLIERALDGLRLRFANNPNWPKGMGSRSRLASPLSAQTQMAPSSCQAICRLCRPLCSSG